MTNQSAIDVAGMTLPAGTWSVCAPESRAAFTVRDKVFATVSGTIPVISGQVEITAGGSVASGWMELAGSGIATGNRRRDSDLAKPALLDLAAHPVLTVEIGACESRSTHWEATAKLTARGRQVPVGLQASVAGEDESGVLVRVTGRLDRSGLGMRVPRLVIGRYVDLDVRARFLAPQEGGASGS